MSKKISKNNVSVAGEFYIAYVLAKHNFIVNMTLGRTKGFDLFAQNPNGVNMTISVKSTYSSKGKNFILNIKDETNINKYLFYAFVKLNGIDGVPEFWIVPSKIVAPLIRETHKIWKTETAKNGTPHKENKNRKFHLTPRDNYPNDWQERLDYYKGNIKMLEELE